jgi:hypothetical protein
MQVNILVLHLVETQGGGENFWIYYMSSKRE